MYDPGNNSEVIWRKAGIDVVVDAVESDARIVRAEVVVRSEGLYLVIAIPLVQLCTSNAQGALSVIPV